MQTTTNVTLASGLKPSEIVSGAEFDHTHVIDLRCTSTGQPRPMEEPVLKRLANRFIRYTQLPMDLNEAGPCQEVHFCEFVSEVEGNTLVLTDEIALTASLLSLYGIPFSSSVIYVVETGKGDFVQAVSETPRTHKYDLAATG